MSKPIEITDQSFEQDVKSSSQPVLVDFWADWCMPCKMIAPIVEELAGEYEGRMNFAKMDIDSNPETPAEFGIRSIPTLLIFKDGVAVDQIIGAVPKGTLQKRLDAVLES
ncbi:MAG: thioredoxin [Chloroflexi bacterium]|nr:thioredoxin [Chloroflexota bacterium]|tara:strand:- start:13132 stop:13461 length:330 start_codon:yes stop_codon:yes gene_type:complete